MRGVGTSFWSLIRRRTIPGFSFVYNAGCNDCINKVILCEDFPNGWRCFWICLPYESLDRLCKPSLKVTHPFL